MTSLPLSLQSAPFAPTQRRFWLSEQLYPNTAVNNVAVAFLLDGPLDAARFEEPSPPWWQTSLDSSCRWKTRTTGPGMFNIDARSPRRIPTRPPSCSRSG